MMKPFGWNALRRKEAGIVLNIKSLFFSLLPIPPYPLYPNLNAYLRAEHDRGNMYNELNTTRTACDTLAREKVKYPLFPENKTFH